MKTYFIAFSLLIITLAFMSGCTQKISVDKIFYNAKVYTVDNSFTIAECFAVNKGKFIAVGTKNEVFEKYSSNSIVDLKGKFVFPGLIDAHCHFVGYAMNLNVVDLYDSRSFDEIISRIQAYRKKSSSEWIIGRGWDQNKWPEKTFPNKKLLDELFPNIPIVLTRIDGHAALVSSEVLKRAGITSKTKVDGGEIVLKNGEPTGIMIDNAMNLYLSLIPEPSDNELTEMLLKAQNNCFAVGLTTVSDAGLVLKTIDLIKKLQDENKLHMRMYAMLEANEKSLDFIKNNKPIKTDFLHVCSVKLYADGALGSRGACLLKPYTDQPKHYGLLTISPDSLKNICNVAYENNYQVCVHAIGDSANRVVLNVFSSILKEKNDKRWRIEHCQVVDAADLSLFGKYSIIPSVQPTHATSDMYWAEERLGKDRIKNAYAYKQLLEQNGWIACGSDFPIEDINPLFGFYAAISRKDKKDFPADGFQSENVLTREQALKGMTIWAARADFEENEKGSIEPGKFADFVILDKNIMEINAKEIIQTKVLNTYIGGERVY